MAENTKTYTAVIDVETKEAVRSFEVLEGQVKTTIGDFENVTEAISKLEDRLRTLDPGSKQFKELSKQLQTLRDRQRDADIASRRFTEALAAQPGVVGLVGQSIEGLRNTFRIFMANPVIAVLAGITGAFLALRESLTRTEEGQEKLNRISKIFTGLLDGLFAIIEPLAFALADFAEKLLTNEKFMDGLAKAAGILYAILIPLGNFVGNQLITAFRALVDVAGGAGKVLKGVFTFDLDLIKDGLSQAKDAVVTGITETVDNAKELGVSLWQNFAEGIEEGSLTFRQRAEDSITGYAEWLKEQRKKLDEDRIKGYQETADVLLDIEEFNNQGMMESTEAVNKFFDEKEDEQLNKKLERLKQKQQWDQDAADARLFIEENLFSALGNIIDQNSKAGKALAIAQTLIDTYRSATAAYRSVVGVPFIGPGLAIAAAASAVAAGLAQVRAIRNTQLPSVASGNTSAPSPRSSGLSLSAPQIPSITAPEFISPQQPVDTGEQIATSLRRQPVKAYVVGSDITSQQQLDRRTNVAAVF